MKRIVVRRLPKIVRQQGVMLIEALIGILIFSLGILALIGLQAVAIKQTSDAKYRADAAFLANQIIAQMWVENPANLAAYAHQTGTVGQCSFNGQSSNSASVTAWIGAAGQAGTVAGTLPGATAANQQILVIPRVVDGDTIGAQVTVTICWQHPNEPRAHNYVATAEMISI